MIFVLHCRLNPGQAERLPLFRAEHRSYVPKTPVKILAVGPTLPDGEGPPIGGLYILEAESREAVEAFYAGEPYAREGIWTRTLLERIDIRL